LEVEGGRAIIYGLGKRRWAVPTCFPQFEGAPNPNAQTPAGKLQERTRFLYVFLTFALGPKGLAPYTDDAGTR